MVLLVCLPLPITRAVGLLALHVVGLEKPIGTLIGFASALGYLVLFFPALLLFEPFALVASLWYTRRFASRSDEPIGRVIACWLAVTVHTAVLATYLRLGR
jgi:nicotinamide riboside transporter PnuC